MAIPEILFNKLIEKAVDKSVICFSKLLTKNKHELLSTYNNLSISLLAYTKKCLKFSESISIFKYSDRLDLQENSIQLTLGNQDRRFYSLGTESFLEEIEFLTVKSHQILLGDPGAGKTTTLKRLVNKTFQILSSGANNEFYYSFPVVVRLSEVQINETICSHLCNQLGIEYNIVEKKITYDKEIDNPEYFYDPKLSLFNQIPKKISVEKTKIIYEYKIGTHSLEYAVGEFLNQLKCIIFFDGLDEVNYNIKDEVFREIKSLSNTLTEAKLILTSRYLQEIPSFKQFNVNEIKPLSNTQKKEIAELWLENSDLFFAKLNKLPYQDVADRPLFLTYLLRLFRYNNDQLPEQAVDVYRQIVLLAIREWDADKEQAIKRFSKYKNFNTYKKEDFLSEIAFELTYSQQVKKIFNHTQLRNAYLNIYRKYPELTFDDQTDIVRDIESHSGLIIETSNETFEFSHLSLQEYLCAKYILSIPLSRKHIELLNIFSAPLAIANVLSAKPEEWFAILFLTNIGEIRASYMLQAESLYEYLDRLLIEKIAFSKPTEELGLAILFLFFKFEKTKVLPKLIEFSKIKYIYESVQKCLYLYDIDKTKFQYHFTLRKNSPTDFFLKCEEKGVLNLSSIKHLIN